MSDTLPPCQANSIAELLAAARAAEQRFGAQLWYRGHARNGWRLVPTAHRRPPILETQLLHHFRLRAPSLASTCPAHGDYAGWLPLMQHYGLPTRLLDWTESLLVAAYFAVSDESATAEDGAVWMLAPGNLNRLSFGELIPFLTDERVRPVVAEAFGDRFDRPSTEAVAVLAPRTDSRMLAQLGNYTIHRSREPIDGSPNVDQFAARIVVPASARDQLRAELSIAGIRRASLFPDLTNLAAELTQIVALDPSDASPSS